MIDTNFATLGQLTPEALQQLASVDVLSKPAVVDEEEVQAVQKIKDLQKSSSFTIKLNGPQLAQLIREADQLGLSWKDHLTARINNEIFGGLIGRALISGPSFASGKTISAPTSSVSRD